MAGSIIFNGQNSLDFGMYVSGDRTFNSPEKDYEKVSVPGRSGDLVIYNNRFKNVNLPYHAIIFGDDYERNAELIRSWLLSSDGYCRLEDSYHPNEYRMACFEGPIDIDTILLQAGETDITFDCKPQRWLKLGEEPITIEPSNNQIIYNPTMFSAKPLIRVYGKGTLSIGSGSFAISQTSTHPYINVDCELLDCYENLVNCNNEVTITKWPELVPGANTITFGEAITKIIVTPRWWTV